MNRVTLAALLLMIAPALADAEADALCKTFGGVKRIVGRYQEQSSVLNSSRLSAECRDGSWVSRTVYK
jgi:hypothetical protein